MALGRQRTHAQLLGQAEREPVSRHSSLDVERLLMRGDLGKEPEDIRLMSPLPLGSRGLEGGACVMERLFRTPHQQEGFSQVCQPQGVAEHRLRRVGLLDRFGHERYRLAQSTTEQISVANGRRNRRRPALEITEALTLAALLEELEGPSDIASSDVKPTGGKACQHQLEGIPGGGGAGQPGWPVTKLVGKLAQLRKTPDEPHARECGQKSGLRTLT